MPRSLFFLAGEASGDLHAAHLIRALKARDPKLRCMGMGGAQMAAAGLEIFKDLDGMQVVGFVEVARQYSFFKEVFYTLLERFEQTRPDALICIDYPGFNLRFAAEARKRGVPCLYYIVPQVWAWKAKRAAKMAHTFDRAFCVFDFEPPFFDRYQSAETILQTQFVGHPLVDRDSPEVKSIEALKPAGDRPTVCFLPGSRRNEIAAHLEPMLGGYLKYLRSRRRLSALFSLPEQTPASALQALSAGLKLDRAMLKPAPLHRVLKVMEPGTAEAIELPGSHAAILPAHADFGVIKSGTSTLEAGLQGKPMCCLYKGNWLSYLLAYQLVDIPVFSLVNIVLGNYTVPELLQGEVNADEIASEIERGLHDRAYISAQTKALKSLPQRLGGRGCAERTALAILQFLEG